MVRLGNLEVAFVLPVDPIRRTIVAALLAVALTATAILAVGHHDRTSPHAMQRSLSLLAMDEAVWATTTTVPPTSSTKPRPSRSQVRKVITGNLLPVSRYAEAGNVNGYPCGGDLPPCWVLRRESHGNPAAVNARGCGGRGCGGLWQFDPWTWVGTCGGRRCADYAGFTRAELAPAAVQNDRARQLWAGGRGCSNWDAC